jgi:diphthine synthase
MLFIIGLGLSDEKDITVKGLEAIKSCERIYLEAYTSILMVSKEKLVNTTVKFLRYLRFKFHFFC